MNNEDIKILTVDDEPAICSIFAERFSRWGYDVTACGSAQEALAQFATESIDIVVTDLNMPEIDGHQLLKRIKQEWPATEVIVVTGFGSVEHAIEAMKNGAVDFILKPVDFKYVHSTIKKCVANIRAMRENKELRDFNSKLVELNELKSKFIAISNHEIRTPMTIIRGYLEILEGDMAQSGPETREIIDILNRTARDLTATLDRMHVLSEIHHTRFMTLDEKIDAGIIIRKVYDDMARLFMQRSIRLTAQLPQQPVWVKGNQNGMKLLIQELLQNALKFTPDNGDVLIKVEQNKEQVMIIIRDSGIGIPADKEELIFNPFYEVQDTIHHKTSNSEFCGGGMGIGLSLVRELVLAMNGRIELDSEVDAGTSININLPVYGHQVFESIPAEVHSA